MMSRGITFKISWKKAITILASFITFTVLYSKAVNRLVVDESTVLLIYAIILFLVNINRRGIKEKSTPIKYFLYIVVVVLIARYCVGLSDLLEFKKDALIVCSCLIIMSMNSTIVQEILKGSVAAVFVILYYWMKFQIEHGGLLHITFIGNRWCLVFFTGAIVSTYLLLSNNSKSIYVNFNILFWLLLVFFTYSRTALLVYFAFAALVIANEAKETMTRKRAILYFFCVVLIMIGIVLSENRIVEMLNGKWENSSMDTSLAYRAQMWSYLLSRFTLLGFSKNDSAFSLLYNNFRVSNFHNVFVQSYVYGAVVSVSYIFLNIYSVTNGVQKRKYNLTMVVGAFIVLGMAESYFLFDYTYTYMSIIFLLMMKLIFVKSNDVNIGELK